MACAVLDGTDWHRRISDWTGSPLLGHQQIEEVKQTPAVRSLHEYPYPRLIYIHLLQ